MNRAIPDNLKREITDIQERLCAKRPMSGKELRDVRVKTLGLSPDTVGQWCGITGQTVLNAEHDKSSIATRLLMTYVYEDALANRGL